MIKVISVYETGPFDDIDPTPKLHVDLEIDGYPWSIGGLPTTWSANELNGYLQANEADMLRQAKLASPKSETYPKFRYDLGHKLPISEHIGKLISVNPSQAKPAMVRRRFHGKNYDVNCLVTQNIVNMWTSNPKQLNVDDFVLVSFIEEIPNTEEREIAIVTDKVFKSW